MDNGFIALAGFCFQDAANNTADEWFMVVDSLGCLYDGCSVGVGEFNEESQIRIYPNPTNGLFHIDLLSSKIELSNSDYTIINISSQIVQQGELKETINVQTLPNGYYILSVLNKKNELYSTPLIISKWK